jgi:uncharacterized membrane protein
LIKALTYRVGGTIITMSLTYLFTGRIEIAVALGIADQLLSSIWYYFHEILWDRETKREARKEIDRWWNIWRDSRYRRHE